MQKKHFTFVELVIVVIVFAALAAVVIPASLRASDKGKMASCTDRLKSCGAGYAAMANDNEGKVLLYGAKGRLWYTMLGGYADADRYRVLGREDAVKSVAQRKYFGQGYMPADKFLNSFRCPDQPFGSGDARYTQVYGAGVNTSFGSQGLTDVLKLTVDGGNFYGYNVQNTRNPDKRIVLADSGYAAKKIQRGDINWHGNATGFMTRHEGKANILFLDGHVGALDGDGIAGAISVCSVRRDVKVCVMDSNWTVSKYSLFRK
ncbi:MAG: prepilin-type N-terminal cleavage/methylation domain-containing protein [Lentisphaeria bacterium]|nr:prepilin-type N-terminal cleavage/methylation domain-containing protein [Lentisphaeria bacterium]